MVLGLRNTGRSWNVDPHLDKNILSHEFNRLAINFAADTCANRIPERSGNHSSGRLMML